MMPSVPPMGVALAKTVAVVAHVWSKPPDPFGVSVGLWITTFRLYCPAPMSEPVMTMIGEHGGNAMRHFRNWLV